MQTMPRRSEIRAERIAEIRSDLHQEFAECAQDADLVGDRRILRSLRKYDNDVEKAGQDLRKYFKLRSELGLDSIRAQLVGKPYCIESLPHGEEASRYFNWVLDAGYTVDGDIVHFYGASDVNLAVMEMDQDKLKQFLLGLFEVTSMQLHERDGAKVVLIIDMHGYEPSKSGMFEFYNTSMNEICDGLLWATVRRVYLLNDSEQDRFVIADTMQALGIGIPNCSCVEFDIEGSDFLANDRMLSSLDLGVLQRVIVPSLHGLCPTQGVLDLPNWEWRRAVIPVRKGQDVSWDVTVEKAQDKMLGDASIVFTGTLYLSSGAEEGIYTKAVCEDAVFSESDGMLGGDFQAQDDGVFVMKFSNAHSWIRWKTVRYKVAFEAAQVDGPPESPRGDEDAGLLDPSRVRTDPVRRRRTRLGVPLSKHSRSRIASLMIGRCRCLRTGMSREI